MTMRMLWLGALCCLAAAARAEKVSFTVETDHTNALYRCGEVATFTVTARDAATGAALRAGTLGATLDNFGSRKVAERTIDLAQENPFVLKATQAVPGFLRLQVKSRTKGLEVEANKGQGAPFVWGVAYEPERITPGAARPADFDAFWAHAVKTLDATVPVDARLEEIPAKSNAQRTYYRVSFASAGGRRVWGWLSMPKGKGPFPVEVSVPGAGIGATGTGGDGRRISLTMNVHSYPQPETPEAREAAYKAQDAQFAAPRGVARYCQAGIHESREAYFYYASLLGINRAVNWLWARPEVDRTRFTYSGTSQGGGFGLMLTGLNGHFTRSCIFVPAITDLLGFRQDGRQSGWPRIVEAQKPENRAAAERWAPYFDGVHFAARITCPVRLVAGFADTVCTPCGVYAAYNAIPARDKRIYNGLGMGHGVDPAFYRALGAWQRAEAAEVRIRRGTPKKTTRVETRTVDLQPLAGGGLRFTLPKGEIPADAWSVEVVPPFMRARKGDDGYWIQARGTYGRLDQDDGAYVKDRQLMPVFGLKRGDTLWYGHVKTWRFDYDFVTVAQKGAYETFPRFRCDRVKAFFTNAYDDIVVDYRPLTGAAADYNGLAHAYRAYQLERGAVRTIKDRMKESPELAYLCDAIVVRIQTHAAKPIPDAQDAKLFFKRGEEPPVVVHMPFGVTEEFLQALKDAGVDKLSICSAGWQDGGYDGRVPGHFPIGAEAGGAEAFGRLVEKARGLGYQFALHASNTDGYMCSRLWSEDWVCKRADGALDKGGLWAGGQCYWVCQKYAWEHWLPQEMKAMAALGIRGPHYIDVYSATYPQRCGDPRHPCTPEQMAAFQNTILAEGRRLMGGAASESGYDHVAGNLDYINYVERDLKLLDEGKLPKLATGVYPLWELVYHGIILYTSDRWCQNHTRGKCLYKLEKSGDPRWMEGDGVEDPRVALKIVEFGGRPIFYTYKFADVPRIRKAWDEFVPVRHLQKEQMTRHDTLAPGVFCTTFGDGSKIVSNYNAAPYDWKGQAVGPVSYLLKNPDGSVYRPRPFVEGRVK